MALDAKDVTLTHSGILSVHGQPYVSVRFERGSDFAEGSLPEAKIMKSTGFDDAEIRSLEQYMEANAKDLFIRAKEISGIKHWF